MSIYDQCNATADARKTVQWAAYRQETWWKDKNIWIECGRNQSTTERDAYHSILEDCGHIPINRRIELRQLVNEVLDDLHRERPYQLIPLKDYLEARGETLYWRDPGLRPAAYVVPLIASGT